MTWKWSVLPLDVSDAFCFCMELDGSHQRAKQTRIGVDVDGSGDVTELTHLGPEQLTQR